MRPPRPRPRHVLLAAALLLAGAAVNVGVAHVCERVQPEPRAHVASRDIAVQPPPSALRFFGGDLSAHPGASEQRDLLCTEREFSVLPEKAYRYHASHRVWMYGLPMRSLQRAEQVQLEPASYPGVSWWRPRGLEGGWPPHWGKASEPRPFLGTWSKRFAILPIPLGFAVNTLVYAALLAAPLPLLPAVRRRRRLRRGLCPRCAYPLAGAKGGTPMCPECGWGASGPSR